MDRWDRVRVLAIEAGQQTVLAVSIGYRELRKHVCEEVARYFGWRWPPAVPLAEDQKEVRSRRDALASSDFAEADRHRRLLEAGPLADAPSQIDGLKLGAMARA